MINIGNYFEAIKTIDFTNLPDALKNGDNSPWAAQNEWSAYNSNENIKRVVDAYLQKLNEWVGSINHPARKRTRQNRNLVKKRNQSRR